MTSARAQTHHARAMSTYLNERLSYQVQGIPWLEHEHPPPGSDLSAPPPKSSYQPPAPTYAPQPQYANPRPTPAQPQSQPPRTNPPVDLNAPVPLSLPGSTLPRLVALGLISPEAGGPNLASHFRVDGQNVCFSITLSQLNQEQMKGLAVLLNTVKGTSQPSS
jgi:hypothetical protein